MSDSKPSRIFGAHAPHPHPTKSAPPTTAISWGPRDLAARHLPPHEIRTPTHRDFVGTPGLRSSLTH